MCEHVTCSVGQREVGGEGQGLQSCVARFWHVHE